MNVYVLDTHALMLWIYQPWAFERMTAAILDLSEAFMAEIVIPAMVMIEAMSLVAIYSRGKDTLEGFVDNVESTGYFRVQPMGLEQVRLLPGLEAIPDLHDRMIASHAAALQAPLVTPDHEIRDSGLVECIW